MSQKGWTGGEDVNWDDVPDKMPEREPGFYKVEIGEAEAEETRAKKPKVRIKLAVEGKLDAEGALQGDKPAFPFETYDNLIVDPGTPFCIIRVKNAADALEVARPASTRFEDVETFAESLVGISTYVELRKGKPNEQGRIFLEVARYLNEADALEAVKAAAAAPQRRKRAS